MPLSVVVMSSEVPNYLSSHSGFNSYASLRHPREISFLTYNMEIFTELKRLLKGLSETILEKVLRTTLGVKYELKFNYFFKIMCFSEFPQNFFTSYISIWLCHPKL